MAGAAVRAGVQEWKSLILEYEHLNRGPEVSPVNQEMKFPNFASYDAEVADVLEAAVRRRQHSEG